VFLSPLKPPTKATISLEAIQSSLYYLHVNTAEDEELKRSIDQERRSEELSRPPIAVARKPLPPTPLSNHPLPPPPQDPQEPQQYRPYRVDPALRPDVASQYKTDGISESDSGLRLNTRLNAGIPRKHISPTGPSNIHDAAGDYALSPAAHENDVTRPSHDSQWDQTHSNFRDTSAAPRYGQADYAERHSRDGTNPSQATSKLDIARRRDVAFLPVTIIRRDPATGSQWNIGTLSMLEPTFSGSNIRPVSVELHTPGYGRFVRDPAFETPQPGSARSDAVSIRRALESATLSPMSAISPETPTAIFNRVVDFKKMPLADLKRTVYQRTNSSDSIAKSDPSKPALERNVLTFESPWRGTCTFVNAIDGKSLRIKHTLNSNSSAAESTTASIGELRFNLGWSLLSNIKDSKRRRKEPEPDKLPIPDLLKTKKENFRQSFQHLKNKSRESFQRSKSSGDSNDALRDLSNIRTPTTNNLDERSYPQINLPTAANGSNQHNRNDSYARSISSAHLASSEDNDDEGRLSLRLGREKAGGGFRGQSAKLGKLIIEDEGLKMCDLVVGAAMGVWWQHYQ